MYSRVSFFTNLSGLLQSCISRMHINIPVHATAVRSIPQKLENTIGTVGRYANAVSFSDVEFVWNNKTWDLTFRSSSQVEQVKIIGTISGLHSRHFPVYGFPWNLSAHDISKKHRKLSRWTWESMIAEMKSTSSCHWMTRGIRRWAKYRHQWRLSRTILAF